MSTSSICSARRTTSSGTVSCCAHAGDPLDHVVERLQVLDVHRGQITSMPGVEQVLDVLPALGVPRARARWCGRARRRAPPAGARASTASTSISVELDAAVGDRPAGHDLQAVEQLGGLGPAVGLDEPDDDVGAALGAAVGLAEHGVGLADARAPRRGRCAARRACAMAHHPPVSGRLRAAAEGQVQPGDVHPRLAEEAQDAPVGRLPRRAPGPASCGRPVTRATRATCRSA